MADGRRGWDRSKCVLRWNRRLRPWIRWLRPGRGRARLHRANGFRGRWKLKSKNIERWTTMLDPEVLRSLHLSRFKSEPEIFAAPGRVNLIGEHTDYAEGFVMPAAINFATLAGISPRTDGKIAVYSENYGEEKVFDAASLPVKGSKHWSDYPMGVVS